MKEFINLSKLNFEIVPLNASILECMYVCMYVCIQRKKTLVWEIFK